MHLCVNQARLPPPHPPTPTQSLKIGKRKGKKKKKKVEEGVGVKKTGARCTKGSGRKSVDSGLGEEGRIKFLKIAGDECACICVLCNQAGYCVRFKIKKKLM